MKIKSVSTMVVHRPSWSAKKPATVDPFNIETGTARYQHVLYGSKYEIWQCDGNDWWDETRRDETGRDRETFSVREISSVKCTYHVVLIISFSFGLFISSVKCNKSLFHRLRGSRTFFHCIGALQTSWHFLPEIAPTTITATTMSCCPRCRCMSARSWGRAPSTIPMSYPNNSPPMDAMIAAFAANSLALPLRRRHARRGLVSSVLGAGTFRKKWNTPERCKSWNAY